MEPDDPDIPNANAASADTQETAVVPIVGIGASAGGLDALKRLLLNIEPHSGMALVVVQHLAPHRESALAEILGRATALPVSQAANDSLVEPDHVYVIPPNTTLTLREGRLSLASPRGSRVHPNVIDEFFTSLAHDRGGMASCVILSGTGSDGTLGLRAVKEHGGLTIAQAEAEYDGMMRSAVSTGLVDFILRPEEIPARLTSYFRGAAGLSYESEDDSLQPETAGQLGQIIGLLRAQTGHDFSNYKETTIIRRVRRRMHVLQISDVAEFIARLRRDPREVGLLFENLLIGVTSFFRDQEAFAALKDEVILRLFEGKDSEDTIRVWVPGCATGEEVYSIAMLLRECAPNVGAPRLQIFASDIDEHALESARVGRYPAVIEKDVSQERLARFFHREDGTYRIASDIREICLFSSHNLLRDAPFSKLDLISCRNLLIYLSPDLQDRIIPLFHYALLPNRYLFLGSSENVARHTRLFVAVEKASRIFRRSAFPERRVPEFPLTAHDFSRRTLPAPRPHPAAGEQSLKSIAERQVIDHFSPAFAVVNMEGDVLHSSGRTGKYLELPPGAPDTNIFSMARPGLRLELRAALHKSAGSSQLAVQSKVKVGANGGTQEIDLYVQPIRFASAPESLYLVVFQDVGPSQPPLDHVGTSSAEPDETGANLLEAELRATKERLQATSEELEASNEELKSGNEELQSMNEELQSANEELQTSKEELQSINEELQTVNAELNARVEELSRANNDMRNLLDSTQIATVFLDRVLNVKGFTPAAKDVFRLVESDAGRPIMHVRVRVKYDTLQEDAERVLQTLGTIERPVESSEDHARYMMRMLPYRTSDNVISGVVLTFTDVTRISAAEAKIERLTEDLRARITELETLLDIVPVGVILAENTHSSRLVINAYGARLLGHQVGQNGLAPVTATLRLFEENKELAPDEHPLRRAILSGQAVPSWEGRLESSGHSVHVMISATPLFGEDRRVRGAIAAIVDISEHKRAQEQQLVLLHELQHRVKNILATVASLATRMARRNLPLEEFHNAFLCRLTAMGRMHDLLSAGAWSGADLRSLIQTALEPYTSAAGSNVRLTGDEVRLDANATSTLGMILNELAINASKYGALSAPAGRVEAAWTQLEDTKTESRLRLWWLERGGPMPDASAPPGFGLPFIRRSVEHELQGTVHIDMDPEGVGCTIEFPLRGKGRTPQPGG